MTAIKRARSPHQPTGQWIRTDARLAIYLRDSFRCLVCCRDLHGVDPADVTLDLVRPKCDGGDNTPANLYTCCRTCNCSRQDKPISRFAPAEARKDIRTHTRRDIRPFRKLAKAVLAGEVGLETTIGR